MNNILIILIILASLKSFGQNAISHLPDTILRIKCDVKDQLLNFELYNDKSLSLGLLYFDKETLFSKTITESQPSDVKNDIRDSFIVGFESKKLFTLARSVTFTKKALSFEGSFHAVDSDNDQITCTMSDELFSVYISGLTSQIQWVNAGALTTTPNSQRCQKLRKALTSSRFKTTSEQIQQLGTNISNEFCKLIPN